MKLAIPTEDKKSIEEHFGGAPYFLVISVEGGKVIDREIREKPSHKNFADEEEHPPLNEEGRHGVGSDASERHKVIYETIKDCDVIIAGRMGFGAYGDMQHFGIKAIVTDVKDIDEAIFLYLDGKLRHKDDRVC